MVVVEHRHMRCTLVPILAFVLVAACGKSDAECRDIQQKCEAIANDIRRAASLRGISSQGVCASSDAQIQKDFGQACLAFKNCNDEHADGCE
jgi:hypothetical protein